MWSRPPPLSSLLAPLVLYDDDGEQETTVVGGSSCAPLFQLVPPDERVYSDDWLDTLNIDILKLRYFSGTELTRLFGFTNFSFPVNTTLKQHLKII